MYTMAGFFCILLGASNLVSVYLYGRCEFKLVETDTDDDVDQVSPKGKQNFAEMHF